MPSSRSARVLGVDQPRAHDPEGDQPLFQRVVVRQWVERAAGRRRGHGLSRFAALHRGDRTGKQAATRRRRRWRFAKRDWRWCPEWWWEGESEAEEGEGRVICGFGLLHTWARGR